jgi:acyl-CoA dehydrogenase
MVHIATNFSISDDQRSLLDGIVETSEKFPETYWNERYNRKEFPKEYWRAFEAKGFFGFLVPHEYGGSGRSFLDFVLAIAKAAEVNAGAMAYLLLSGALVAEMFASSTQPQKLEILRLISKGSVKISIALTEQESGQQVRAINTVARQESDGDYVISGEKTFVNNANVADFILVFARLEREKENQIVPFLVESKHPALVKTEQEKIGHDPLRMYSLKFERLTVRKSSLICGDDNYDRNGDTSWQNSLRVFAMDRIATAVLLTGTGKLAIREAASYANRRQAFGKPIGANQGIQFPLAESYANLDAAENIAYRAAWLCDKGDKQFSLVGAIALSKAVRASLAATDSALQCFGGHGYLESCPAQRHWRDIRAYSVHPMSKELLTAFIAERALGLPRSY